VSEQAQLAETAGTRSAHHFGGRVGAAVVDENHLEGHAAAQRVGDFACQRLDVFHLVAHGNDD
jgi:hypothetical protein